MDIFYGVMVLILGLIVGSFLNVCIYRVPRGESIAFPPSHCAACSTPIKKYDLVPVISFIFLGGRCRYCRDKISFQYPITELITGAVYIILFLTFGLSIEFVFYIILTSILILTSIIDLKTGYIYEYISFIGIGFGIAFVVYKYFTLGEFLPYIIGGVVVALILSIFAIFGGMGWGDVEIAFMCGLYLGFSSSLLMLFLSIIIGGIIGIIILILRKNKGKEDNTMPFGPCIALGCFISLLYGEGIIKSFLIYYGL